MSDLSLDERLWAHYPSILQPVDRAQSPLQGLSGAIVWKVATEPALSAARRHPMSIYIPTPRSAHEQMTAARAHGWAEVPQPLPNNDGETFTKHDDSWWDVCTWQ